MGVGEGWGGGNRRGRRGEEGGTTDPMTTFVVGPRAPFLTIQQNDGRKSVVGSLSFYNLLE